MEFSRGGVKGHLPERDVNVTALDDDRGDPRCGVPTSPSLTFVEIMGHLPRD